MIEIVTEKESSKKRYVDYNKRRVALRRAKTDVTENNYKILQVIELEITFKKLVICRLTERFLKFWII